VRLILTLVVLAGALLFLLPTFLGEIPEGWPSFLPMEKVRLGLDLQGGMHLLLEVEAEEAVKSTLERIKNDLKDDLRKRKVFFTRLERVGDGIEVVLLNEEMKPPFQALLETKYAALKVKEEGREGDRVRVVLMLDPRTAQEIKKWAVEQALETIRNRVDQFGVAEPEIARQGTDRILVQLPGEKDPERAKSLIGKTAMLEFKLLDEEHDLRDALAGNVPPGSVILYQRKRDPATGAVRKIPYLVKEKTLLTGEALKDARVAFDQFNRPYISLTFTPHGAKEFERITGENVGKRLAIILDGTVYSAPVIKERISGGRAVIEGDFTLEEAHDLAIVLRAGALPAPVRILEERTVGPSLGKDSIDRGIRAIILGGVLVVLFMAFYYRWAGLVADFALGMNLLVVLAVMVLFRATLTLPGIAGLVLTVGMAVDANVLIFERIREELRLGKTPRAAVDAGYSKALLTILDAQITTLIAAVVLYQFGTGPIRGFAVTLSVGIIASLFTAVMVTKTIFDLVLSKRQVRELKI